MDDSLKSCNFGSTSQDLDSGRSIASFDVSSPVTFETYESRGQSTPVRSSPNKKTDGSPDSGNSDFTSQDLDSGYPITSTGNSSPIPYRQSRASTDDWNLNSVKFPKHVSSPSYNWTVFAPFALNTKVSPFRQRSISETESYYSSSSNLLSFQDNGVDLNVSTDGALAILEIESRPIIKDVARNFYFQPLKAKSRSLDEKFFDTSSLCYSNPSNQLERYAEKKETDCYRGNFDINVVEKETDNYGNVDINVAGKERETDNYGNVDINVAGKERETDNYHGDVDINVAGKERETDHYHGNVDNNVVEKKVETSNYRGNLGTKVTRRETCNEVNFEPKVFDIKESITKHYREDLVKKIHSCVYLNEKLKRYVESEKQMILSTSEACGNSSMVKMESHSVERNENDKTDFDTASNIFYTSFMKLNTEIQRQIENINIRIVSQLNHN